jgi:D-alanyl-D-alanine dipeptidase
VYHGRVVVRLLSILVLALGLVQAPVPARAPAVPLNQYGLPVVERLETYRQQALRERDVALVDLRRFVPGLRVRLAYTTPDNPTGRVLYDARRAYLRLPAALALRAAQRDLARRDAGLLVYDAYRPYAATLALWAAVGDSAYAAPPPSGSRHNRGAAVDVGLVDLRTGEPLRMPTAYDVFTPAAAQGYNALPAAAVADRELLRSTMERHGFRPLASEWWHYDFKTWPRFSLLDLRLGAVARVRPRFDVWLLYPPASRLALLAPPRADDR